MDTSRIDLNLLMTLEALLAERNVTKAAARLHLSQPAVSAQLSRLRDLFDDPLLVPAHRGMTPTAKALDLLSPLREALDQLRDTLQAHRDFSPLKAGMTVSIACTDYVQAVVVMPLALALRQRAPGVRVAVRNWDPARIERQLARGEVDLAVTTPDPRQPQLRTRHLFDETYVLVGRKGHPQLKRGLSIKKFVGLEHVIVSPSGGGFTTPVDDVLATLGHQRNVVLSAASFLFVPEIVAMSELVALVPKRLASLRSDRLALVEVPWLAERFNVSLIWHERSHTHAGHLWIRELIAELIPVDAKSPSKRPVRFGPASRRIRREGRR
jgi:DNA-binding transcriptional LysR family regulator